MCCLLSAIFTHFITRFIALLFVSGELACTGGLCAFIHARVALDSVDGHCPACTHASITASFVSTISNVKYNKTHILNKSNIIFISKSLAGPLNMPIHGSSGSHSQLVSITSSCSLVAFPLSVSLVPLHLLCLCSSVSQTRNCARVLKAAELAHGVSHPTRMDSKPCMCIILLQSVTQRYPTQVWSI